MYKHVVILLTFWLASPALAFWGPISFVPAAPTTNDGVSFQMPFGICDAFLSNLDAEIEVTGSVIKVTKTGISITDPILCNIPISSTTTFIGRFPSGVYRFELYRRENLRPTVVDLVQTANLTIAAAPAVELTAAPTLSPGGLAALVIALLLASYSGGQKFSSETSHV
jgi:hypothetical protein